MITIDIILSILKFLSDLPFIVRIQQDVKCLQKVTSYSEDLTISKKNLVIDTANQLQTVSNIELKYSVSSSWQRLSVHDLIETVLYARYFLKMGQALNQITAVLTDLFTWHIFTFKFDDNMKQLELVNYFKNINPDNDVE